MDKDNCYAFIERFSGGKCEQLYYCFPGVDFPKCLRLIRNELEYADFIAIAYECGAKVPMYVDHFGNTNMQEWLDEEREKIVDNIQEEVVDDIQVDAETSEIRHRHENINPRFFKKGNAPDYEMAENESEEADDLPNIFNEEQHWKDHHVLGMRFGNPK
uniref:Uncharacterized protein n=1 Tax=Lactuca sativa TaxID=4236 RepID=A0A9R1XUH5_LACSA|nr:hypothetical protein LSAT_V11C100000880 [Lactuca sativa]